MTKTEPTLSQIYYVVLPLVRRAGQMLVARQKELSELTIKARHARGKEIEQEIYDFLADTLLQLFPEHSVHGRDSKDKSTWQWVANPLDGGRYYFRGLPLFTTSLALRQKGEVVLGIVFQPTTENIFQALKGEGAYLNNKQIKVSTQKDWEGSSVYLAVRDGGVLSSVELKAWQTLSKAGASVRDLGVTSLGLCYIAVGVFDMLLATIDQSTLMKQTAGLIIAREAGAKLSDGVGQSLGGGSKPTNLLAVTSGLQSKALAVMGKK